MQIQFLLPLIKEFPLKKEFLENYFLDKSFNCTFEFNSVFVFTNHDVLCVFFKCQCNKLLKLLKKKINSYFLMAV